MFAIVKVLNAMNKVCLESLVSLALIYQFSILYKRILYLPNPSVTRSIFKWSIAGLNSEFSIKTDSHTKAKELSLPYYLAIAEEGRDRFITV